jgi:ABC-type amino acid transport substrate-binding protein
VMKNTSIAIVCVILGVGLALFGYSHAKQTPSSTIAHTESAYNRVMRTGELRCGYFTWTPSFIKDPNSGAMSGLFHDYLEALGQALNLKIVWAEEVALGEVPAALKSGRIDAMCASTFVTSARARVIDFVTPFYYVPIHAFASADDNRFTHFTPDRFNTPAYTVSTLEGGVTSILQKVYLPKTKLYELPQFTSPSELFTSLHMGKADFVLYENYTFEDYNAHNPGQLKRVSDTPIKIFPLAIAVDKNQDALREMLSTATMDLHLAGTTEGIIEKYERYPNTLIRMRMPYRE